MNIPILSLQQKQKSESSQSSQGEIWQAESLTIKNRINSWSKMSGIISGIFRAV